MAAIAVFTESGNTARMLSKHRPKTGIVAFSQFPEVCNRMNILWGVRPVLYPQVHTAEDMVLSAEAELKKDAVVKAGDVIGVVAGTRQASGSTNFMRLHVVRESAPRRALRRPKR